VDSSCEQIAGGEEHADMLKLHFNSLSKISKLFIFEGIADGKKDEAEKVIRECIGKLGIGDYFDGVYALDYMKEGWLGSIEKVPEMKGLDKANLYFIGRRNLI